VALNVRGEHEKENRKSHMNGVLDNGVLQGDSVDSQMWKSAPRGQADHTAGQVRNDLEYTVR